MLTIFPVPSCPFQWPFKFFFVILSFNGKTALEPISCAAKLLVPKILMEKIPRTGMQKLVQKRLVNNEPRRYSFSFFHRWDILWDLLLTVPGSWKPSQQHSFEFIFWTWKFSISTNKNTSGAFLKVTWSPKSWLKSTFFGD